MNEKEYLNSYDSNRYWKPSMAADILVFSFDEEDDLSLKLLLIKRKNHPYQGCWALPGGFLEEGETLLETAHRELKEETGITGVHLKQLSIWDDPDRDKRTRIITLAYLGVTSVKSEEIIASDDASEAALFDLMYEYEENVLSYTLSADENKLSAKILINQREDVSKKFEILESKGIAFDHPKLIAHGLERLQERKSC